MPEESNKKISEMPNYKGGFSQAVADNAMFPVAIGEISNAKIGAGEISSYINRSILSALSGKAEQADLDRLADKVNSHIKSGDEHVAPQERDLWNNKVSRSGDTMTGDLTMSGSEIILESNGNEAGTLKADSEENAVSLESLNGGGINLVDSMGTLNMADFRGMMGAPQKRAETNNIFNKNQSLYAVTGDGDYDTTDMDLASYSLFTSDDIGRVYTFYSRSDAGKVAYRHIYHENDPNPDRQVFVTVGCGSSFSLMLVKAASNGKGYFISIGLSYGY